MNSAWKLLPLNEIGEISRGKSRHRPRNAPHLYGGKYPLIQTGDIQAANFYISTYNQTYSDAGLAQSKLWAKGTLCISIVGSNTAATAILGFDACFPDSVIGFNSYKDISDTKFVKYCLELLRVHMKSISEGAARENLSLEKLLTVKLPIPPLETQTQIANILSAYDDLIENNLRRIKLLEEMAELTYREWFVNFKIDGKTLEIDKNTGLPFGWERKSLVEVANLVMGQSPESKYYNEDKNGLPFHQGVTGYGFRFPSNSTWSEFGQRSAEKGDILFSVRAPVGRLNLSSEKILIGRGLSAIRHNSGNNSFLFYQLKNLFFKDDLMGGGAIFNSVTKKEVENISVIEPQNDVLNKFNQHVIPIDSQILNLSHQNRLLKESRDILLPRLMSGEVGV